MLPVTSLQTLLAAADVPVTPPVLQPGTVTQAMVAQLLDATTMRLQLPGGAALDVKTDLALPPGTRVQVAVEGTLAQPKILLTPLPPLPASPGGAQSAQGTGQGAGKGTGQAAQQPLQAAPANPASSNSIPGTIVPGGAPAIETAKPLPASVQLVLPNAPDAPNAPKQALQAAVTAMVRDAVSKQNGLAPLMADVEAALARPDLPAPVRAAAAQLLGLRIPTSAPVTAPDIKAAIMQSGLAGDPVTLQPAQPNADLKVALTTLKETLTNWIAKEQGAAPEMAPGKQLQLPLAAPGLPPPQRATLPPPHRLGPVMAQPPSPATLPEEASARDAAQHLLKATDGALARQTLLQIASLPDESTNRATESGPRLTLDIPLATLQGNAVAQLRIEQEPSKREGPDIRPVWRAQFSIDLEPIGPVHASIALFGDRAAVTLYAERDASAEHLRDGLPVLEASLKDAAFETGELLCRAGAPSAPRSAPGLFVDQAS
jgi:hypothetical protein